VKSIHTHFGVNEDGIEVIPTFIDPDFRSTDSDRRATGETFTVLFVGRLVEMKGVSTLIEAAKLAGDGISINIVGDGPYRESLERYALELGVDSTVDFRGWVDYADLPNVYAKADVLVHPAEAPEAFGRTLLEGFQHELPAIVSDIGAPPWVVGDAGLVFEPRDAQELSDKIQSLRDDPSLYTRLRDRTTDRVNKFSKERTVDQVEAMCRSIT
jgi:glycosyltransferase involved in cell wall biosynthesis